MLGKTLRIAPNLNGGYATPSSNPYDGSTPGLDEIWAIGLRNPWRASFDRETDGLWIADVGQGSWEEINRVGASAAGRNYGWDCREGFHAFESTGCSGVTFQKPLAEYGHAGGNCAVTGGYVYRGQAYDDLQGQYVLGDFCSGRLWTVSGGRPIPSSAEVPPRHLGHDLVIRRVRERRALSDRLRRRPSVSRDRAVTSRARPPSRA